jgi:hypothetical protein
VTRSLEWITLTAYQAVEIGTVNIEKPGSSEDAVIVTGYRVVENLG